MSRRIYAQRTSHPPTHASREMYLQDSQGSFCKQLQRFSSYPWVTVVLGPGWLSDQERREAMLRIIDRLDRATARLDPEVWLVDLPDGSPLEASVHDFAVDMSADRLGLPAPEDIARTPAPGHGGGPDAGDEWAAKVLITSLLTTNLFFTLRALEPAAALHRSGHEEEATALAGSTAVWVHRRLVARVIAALDELNADLESATGGGRALAARVLERRDPTALDNATSRFLESFQLVLTTMKRDLDPGRGAMPNLASTEVRALSELAWFAVSSFAEEMYPGWLDLLLELSQYDQPGHGHVGRPSFDNVSEAGEAIRARYERLTTTSWNRRRDATSHPSSLIHDNVAHLLVQQAQLRPSLPKRKPPPAVAHVTSFDLELEMALLRTGQAFHVIFPVHVMDGLNDLAHSRWALLDVKEGAGLDALLRPATDAVRILTAEATEVRRLRGPFIVRLAGCPLIDLPPLRSGDELTDLGRQVLGAPIDDDGRRKPPGDGDVQRAFRDGLKKREPRLTEPEIDQRIAHHLAVRHAVIVNEYDAMLHNAMDTTPRDEEATTLCQRLPIETVADNHGWQRYWMLLGVQVGDHAMRQRVSHVVSWYPSSAWRKSDERDQREVGRDLPPDNSDGTEGDATGDEAPATNSKEIGVLVCQKVGHLEQDLLYWNRLEIVEHAETHRFAGDIEHIATHHLDAGNGGAMVRCHHG